MADKNTEIKILLAEDAKIMRRIEIKALNELGYSNIIEANDGAEAIELLDESIDLIISDWNMPNKSGLELLTWVRADEKFKKTPFLMATAQSDKEHLKKAEDAGTNGFIAKPFANDELKDAIDRAFGKEVEVIAESKVEESTVDGKTIIKIAHIQITDHLILGVLKDMIEKGDLVPEHFHLETVCMPGWNSVYSDLESGKVDAACVLAPIAMELFSIGTPIKLILLAHRSGSISVKNVLNSRDEQYSDFYKDKSFLIPHKMSVHHMLTHMFFKGIGLNPNLDKGDEYDIELEVVPPVHMPEFLRSNEKNAGFMVAEPIGSKAIKNDIGKLEFYTNELWERHPCCVVAARDNLLENETDAAHEFTRMLVQAGKLIEEDPDRASKIAVTFLDPDGSLGLNDKVLKKVITDKNGIRTGDLYPDQNDLNEMQQYMFNQMGVGSVIDLDKFIDTRFADIACKNDKRVASLLKNSSEEIKNLMPVKNKPSVKPGNPQVEIEEEHLVETREEEKVEEIENLSGKYLTFSLAEEEYGISILKIKEIIGMMNITVLPQLPAHIKGVINLRDQVIPIMDLRLKFGMEEVEHTDRTCIIILEVLMDGLAKNIGVIVDSVSEVLPIENSEVEKPSLGLNINTDYILAMAKKEDSVKTLLNIEMILH
jgi:chemotaxis signal transduction protein/CheY-like chemotaxis protein